MLLRVYIYSMVGTLPSTLIRLQYNRRFDDEVAAGLFTIVVCIWAKISAVLLSTDGMFCLRDSVVLDSVPLASVTDSDKLNQSAANMLKHAIIYQLAV